MSGAPQFSIIIVTYNSRDWIEPCLAALSTQSFQDFEVIIVDNASTDGTQRTLSMTKQPEFDFVENDENEGFAAACNQGTSRAKSDWLIFLNPDTVADPDWLLEIIEGQSRHPQAAAFASTQLNLEDPRILDGAGDVYSLYGIAWRGAKGAPVQTLPEEGECFSPCGAAMTIRSDLFRALGGFNEQFFCYYEDVDLGFRLRLMGHYCIFLPEARVKHHGGASSELSDEVPGEFSIYYGVRNRFWTYIGNMPLGLLILTMPAHIIITALQVFSARKTGHVRIMLSALKAALVGTPRVWTARAKRPQSKAEKPRKLYSAFCKSIPKLLRQASHTWAHVEN